MKEHSNPDLRTSPLESRPVSKFGRAIQHAELVPDRIPARVKPDERLVSLISPATVEAEQYRTLGLMLEQRRHSGLLQVVAVSSPTMGDGKTVTSINLAAALAQSPQSRVLLVDADFRKPSVPTQMGLRDGSVLGLRDAILNPNLALKDIVRRLPAYNLSVATVGRAQVMPHEIFKSTRFAELIDEAVVIRSPAALGADAIGAIEGQSLNALTDSLKFRIAGQEKLDADQLTIFERI